VLRENRVPIFCLGAVFRLSGEDMTVWLREIFLAE
jgi:hypothetical protein